MTLEEVQDLLASPELAEIQAAIAAPFRHRVVPEPAATPYQRELTRANLSSARVIELFTAGRPRLVRLGTSLLAASAGGQDDEEAYPAGEEAAPEPPNAQMIGLQNGFALTYACYLHLLDRPPDELTGFLKWRRIPGAARFARQLRKYARP